MKKVLITGASGFIGSFLVEDALAKGYDVYAGIRATSSRLFLTDKRIKFIELNMADEQRLSQQLNKNTGTFDCIIHNAGITKAHRSEDFFNVNYHNTKHLVSALIKNKSIPEKFIYISSLAAMGPGTGASPISTTDTPRPITAYGESKLKTERYLLSLKDFPALIIRPAAVYGPRDKAFLTLFKLIHRKLETYIGNDEQRLSFIYVSDLAKAVIAAMESSFINRSWFISDGFEYTSRTFNTIIKDHLQRKTIRIVIPSTLVKPVSYGTKLAALLTGKAATFSPERLKELQAPNWTCDATAMKNDLNFLPQFNLQNGIRETARWYLEHGWL